MSYTNSGDYGYCAAENKVIGVLYTWNDNVVTDISCNYKSCLFSESCELFQRQPIGYKQSYPLKPDKTE